MTMESDLVTLLQVRCPRVHPLVAPLSTTRPYITWQHIGGRPLRYTENTAANKRHSMVQLNVWAATMLDAMTLIRQLEDDLCASTAFEAVPDSEPIGQEHVDFETYGAQQDFSIFATR